MKRDQRDGIGGSLLAGAIGDCLGAATEFTSMDQIRRRFGPNGLTEIHPPGRFTDDTQMTLFTVVGVIRALLDDDRPSASQWTSAVHGAYLEWLVTQELEMPRNGGKGSWLVHESTLYRREAPGMTCLSALRSGEAGTLEFRINDSKGCGGVMRAAPIGLLLANTHSPAEIYEIGCLSAAVTHGHDGGIHPSGALAVMVADCLKGTSVRQAVENVRPLIPRDLARQLTNAVRLATSGVLTPETLCDELGQGWVGDEALAIAVACAIGANDLEAALLLAINHDGDTDSTGSICGNLLGAGLDWEAVPKRFVAAAPQAPLVREVVEDCHRFIHGDRSREFVDRYARRD